MSIISKNHLSLLFVALLIVVPAVLCSNKTPQKVSDDAFDITCHTNVKDWWHYIVGIIGGAIACGFTHLLITPIDLVKCRKQIDPLMYPSLMEGFRSIYRSEGFSGLYVGWIPTIIGYSLQGACKFGLYYLFTDYALNYAQIKSKDAGYLVTFSIAVCKIVSSACAEFFADIPLAPCESLKFRMQTSHTGYARSTLAGFSRIYNEEGFSGFFKGIVPLWVRQIIYTVVKFIAFEKIYDQIKYYSASGFTEDDKKANFLNIEHPTTIFGTITFIAAILISGFFAGVICAAVSHPFDSIYSKMSSPRKSSSGETQTLKGGDKGEVEVSSKVGEKPTLSEACKELGFSGIWNGLFARCMMVGLISGLQWLTVKLVKYYLK